MRYLLALCSCFFTLSALELKDFNWPQQIQGDAITLKHFLMEMPPPAVELWSIQDEEDRPVGMIFVSEGAHPIADAEVAADLRSQNKVFELSYGLVKDWGRGLGSKAVKAWIDHARQNAWGKYVYALVDANNTPSIRILEKNGCFLTHSYSDQELTIRVYSLE